ncbi:MAG: bifunctional oligoribonuclease/PAP phosphatase NrnA [bacterium]
MDEEIKELIQALMRRKNVVIVGHTGADGDSIGASLALASFLRRLGVRVTNYQKDRIPDNLQFLDAGRIKRADKIDLNKKDALIFMECFLPGRSGFDFGEKLAGLTTVNIDHHPDNKMYADFNIVDAEVSSVSEIVYRFFEIQGLPVQKTEAVCLLTGIITDTGRFSQKNTTKESLRIAASMMEAGAEPVKIYNRSYGSQKPETLRLLSATLGTLEIIGGKISAMYTSCEMFRKTKTTCEDTKDFINFARDIKGVEASCYIREVAGGSLRINFRSVKKNILPFAKKFGGGGHNLACGGTIKGKFSETREKIIKDFVEYMTNHD